MKQQWYLLLNCKQQNIIMIIMKYPPHVDFSYRVTPVLELILDLYESPV